MYRDLVAVAFNSAGNLLLTGSNDGTAKIWDALVDPPAQRGSTLDELRSTPIRTLSASAPDATVKPQVKGVAYSALDDRIAAASSDGSVRIWAAQSGEVLLTLSGHRGGVAAVGFAPHGNTITTAGHDGVARIWNLNSGGEIFSAARTNAYPLLAIAFSPDGKHLSTAGADNVAQIWDNSGNELHQLVQHSQAVFDATFSRDGKHLATASIDRTLNIWDVASGKLLRTLPQKKPTEIPGFYCVAFSPDGKTLAAGDWKGTVTLWDEQSGVQQSVLPGHQSGVWAVSFSPNGKRLATASLDNTAKIWDLNSQKMLFTLNHKNAVQGIAFSPDGGRIATASRDGTAKLWDADSGKELLTFRGHTDSVSDVAFMPDGRRLVTSSWDGTIKLWDSSLGSEQMTLLSPVPVIRLAVSPDGRRLGTANQDGVLRIYAARLPDLIAQAMTAVGRPLTDQECKKYLHAKDGCSQPDTSGLQRLEQGLRLARKGDLKSATEALQNAQKMNHLFTFDPETEAKKMRAAVLVAKGRNLADNGDLSGARANFDSALTLDRDLGFDPDDEAKSLVAMGRVVAGISLARRGRISDAMKAYDKAKEVDSAFVIDALALNDLCWNGSLAGYARQVMSSCRQAVKLRPNDSNVKDSLGVALVLAGRPRQAIPFFQEFVRKTDDQNSKQRRLAWIPVLQRGENPLNKEELEWLSVN